uniref:N-acetylated-alpha-linked acidic dipeptidase-like protein n=1 Tax=Gadus morhua TaxID=8049 RepID=A0A8C5A081_GADMO
MLKKVLIGSLGGAAVLTVGILLGHYAIDKGSPAPSWLPDVSRDLDESLLQDFMDAVDNKKIEGFLRDLTKVPHMATSAGDEATVEYMMQHWNDQESGLDQAWRQNYVVYLSFPDPKKPNKVTVVAPNTTVLHTAREREKSYGPDQDDPEVVQPYAAYSPAGSPQGKLVYANQGKPSDYMLLNKTLDLRGTIAICRYGGAGRAEKAINAAPYGVVGVLVYSDPLDINDGLMSDSNETYPHSWYMPPSGVERGSFNTDYGDLLTPYLAAKESTYRIPVENITGIPPIPIQPIGFEDAYVLIRYVIYGNHRDSWVHGAIDPSSGTSVMLEVTRVLGRLLKQGRWRPRRSIIFGSWGAEEFGLIGSTEYTEQYYTKLSERTVAYINVDIAVFANATLRASGMPSVQNLIFTAAKQVKAPGLESTSVYDNWLRYSNRTSPAYGTVPRVGYLTGAGSDYAAFVHYLGITAMDFSYTYDRTKTKARIYPAYHTAYDTFDYASRYIDPGFTSHQAVARTAGNVLLRLADSLLLPLNVSDYAETLEAYLATALELHQAIVFLKSAVDLFRSAATQLDQIIKSSDLVRRINDQLMLMDRAFLDPQAFPEKHVIWASSSSGHATFPGFADAFARASLSGLEGDWFRVHHQISILSQAINGAAHMLMDGFQ